MLLLISGGTIVTLETPNRVIPGGWLLIRGDTVADLGIPSDVAFRNPEVMGGSTLRRIDATGQVVLPGLVCAHHHLYSTFARGAPLSGDGPASFKEILEGLWWKLDRLLVPGDVRLSAIPALLAALRAGTTTIIDHHESQGYQEGVLDELAQACREVGVRACLTLGASDRYGRGAEGVQENRRFIASLSPYDPFVRGMVGLHASFTVGPDTLAASAQLARETASGLHVHVAEDPMDQEDSVTRHGVRVVERLERAGALGDKTLLAHALHLDDAEREAVARTGSWVIHNPESNMNNGLGAADVLGLVHAGIPVALGTDGISSDMRHQARSAFLLQRHLHRDARVALAETLQMVLATNARLASKIWGRRLGVLTDGAMGDVVTYHYDPPTPLTAENFGSHFLFGLVDAPVGSTVVSGHVRFQDGVFPHLDVARELSGARAAAVRFWDRFRAAA
jgi:putative selenium metabolism protein SsnA